MPKFKTVVDTNIFISGLSSAENDSCTKILNLIEKERINVLFAQDTFGELIYVAKHFVRKFLNSKKEKMEVLNNLVELFYKSLSINTVGYESPKCLDKYDDMFIKCALAGNADYLITDDFKSGMHSIEFDTLKVVSSGEFIDIWNDSCK